jgi:hypothetical protein
MDWRDYEREIFDRLRQQFPGTELVRDARLDGFISGIQRQIDILARSQLIDTRPFAVIDKRLPSSAEKSGAAPKTGTRVTSPIAERVLRIVK